jgi:hypothetical protein
MEHSYESIRGVRFSQRVVQLQRFLDQRLSFRRRVERSRVNGRQSDIGLRKVGIKLNRFAKVLEALR